MLKQQFKKVNIEPLYSILFIPYHNMYLKIAMQKENVHFMASNIFNNSLLLPFHPSK